MNSLIRIQHDYTACVNNINLFLLACVIHNTERKRPAPGEFIINIMISAVNHCQQHVTGSRRYVTSDSTFFSPTSSTSTTLIDSTECSNGKNFPDYNQVQNQQAKANISLPAWQKTSG